MARNPTIFCTQLTVLNPGELLLPAEGEGRNAVYAAQLGRQAYTFDQSVEGEKTLDLAQRRGLTIHSRVDSGQQLPCQLQQFGALGLIYAYFPAELQIGFTPPG